MNNKNQIKTSLLKITDDPAEEALIGFIDQHLQIYKKDETGPQKAVLTASRWRHQQGQIQSHQVRVVWMMLVLIEDCTGLFNFISKCTNVTELCLYELSDSSGNNHNLIQGLSHTLHNLNKLLWFELRDTPLGGEGGVVFSSISSPYIRVLDLANSIISGSGNRLTACLTRLHQLGYLNLNGCCLSKDEVQAVVAVLPQSCPRLSGLLMTTHDLTRSGLDQVVAQLPSLKILVIDRCTVYKHLLENIIENTPKAIENMSINNIVGLNQTINSDKLCDILKQRRHIKYLRVSGNQLSVRGQQKVRDVLALTGGRLLVDVQPGHEQWDDYISHFNRIRDQCLKD